jgi:hypothetical protein
MTTTRNNWIDVDIKLFPHADFAPRPRWSPTKVKKHLSCANFSALGAS